MKINSINQQNIKNKPNFNGVIDKTVGRMIENPGAVAALAGSSVIAQKIIMSSAEAGIGPVMDLGIGHTITKVTDEKDGRTNEASQTQAIRTFSQAVGGTIVGVIIRAVCIGAITTLFMKTGKNAGGKIADIINKNDKGQQIVSEEANKFLYKEHMEKWGKNAGGLLATLVMLGTNFVIDAPFINWINGKITKGVNKIKEQKELSQSQKPQQNTKEVK